jgi:LysR family transcriptional regulator, hydrogen peroxide-inducible genes activator
MNLRDLEYAVCLASEGQFRRAAERCHVSQPTLSAQIAKLEDELGLQLFERGPRAVTPTVMGARSSGRRKSCWTRSSG